MSACQDHPSERDGSPAVPGFSAAADLSAATPNISAAAPGLSAAGSGGSPALSSTAWIGLGANLPSEAGHPAETLRAALAQIAALPGVTVQAASSLYDSSPVDSDGPRYCNQVVRVKTSLDAPSLLGRLQAIEQAFGRQRPYRNAPRTLDLDVLMFDDEVRTDAALILPHPRMHERLFVLMPLAEIDAGQTVPGRNTVAVLLAQLQATVHGQDCRRIGN